MKTLAKTTLSLIMMIVISSANTYAVKRNKEKLTINYAVNIYVNAIAHGETQGLNDILDKNLKYTMFINNSAKVLDKSAVLNFYKDVDGIDQGCSIRTKIQDKTPDVTIARVDQVYDTFTRTNYVTFVNSNTGWKITNVYTLTEIHNNQRKR